MTALLKVENLSKRFGGLVAVKDVSFELQPGEITGILGPNGAGKTTLFNLLTGFIPMDQGTVTFDGERLNGLKPYRIVNKGMARTFQLVRPFVGMTVLENVVVGCLAPRVSDIAHSMHKRAQEILDQVGLGAKSDWPVEILTYGDQRRLEIARALATKPKLLLLDEPFAGLGTSEIEPLATLIRRLHREEGLTILIIEHRLQEFMALVSRVIAIDFGAVIATGTPAEIVRHPKVVEAYIGRTEEVPLGAA
jgi:branched-chain amino acid transport system ATP-binding protein